MSVLRQPQPHSGPHFFRVAQDVAVEGDDFVGHRLVLIKPIGEIARFATGVSGAAILADGGIALILDVAALAKAHKGLG